VTTHLDGPGVADVQTVTSSGESTVPVIDGVLTHRPPVHLDHRGSLFEIYDGGSGASEMWDTPVVYAYQCSVFPGQIKGWARHAVKTDRYSLATGELLVLLHDGRPDSPTCGLTQRVVLSARGDRQLMIPPGVWHLLLSLGTEEVQVLNLPTEPYHHDAPDRILLPWDSDELPVDVRAYLPRF
jgi:dTDP-4-dehydrorhamnose 3,5-epimerase